MKLRIENNKRKWLAGPYFIKVENGENLKCICNGKELPSQFDSKEKILAVNLPDLQQNETVEIELKEGKGLSAQVKMIENNQKGIVDIMIGEEYFSTYHYKNVVRPFLNPLITVKGKSVLRPPAAEGNPEKLDHIHHRGVWVAHGDINGVDNWSEVPGIHGWTVHQEFLEITSGPVFGKLRAKSFWMDHTKTKKICEEERIIIVYNMPASARIIDHITILKATEGELVFKDTKESGLLSVRVMPSMQANRQGTFVNSIGGINEDECWGKRADWCDYYGPVDDTLVGIAIFDNPKNLRYPTWWHIRNYGLMSANFFGLSEFTGDKTISGTYILGAYQELKLWYRLFVHEGDTKSADVSTRYLNFIHPPIAQKV